MAKKSEKRAAMRAKREQFEKTEKARGLKSLAVSKGMKHQNGGRR